MQPTDRPAFLATLNGLALTKPGASKLTPEALDLWWQSMQHWSIRDFKAAAAQLNRTMEFMPSAFHFEQLRKAGRATAGEAWIRAVQACGSCREVTRAGANYGSGGSCGDALTDRAVQCIGGYRAIALADTERMHFLERRFAEHYEQLQDVEDTREALPQITNQPTRARLNGPTSARDVLGRLGRDAPESDRPT